MRKEIIISRHAGAIAWLREVRGLKAAAVAENFSANDIQELNEGDRVVGTLPITLVVEVLAQGAIFDLIVLPRLALSQRGSELSPTEMNDAGAKLIRVKGLELEEVEDQKKGENELSIANAILGIVSNLGDEDEAMEYARLYIKAVKEAAEIAGEEYDFDEDEVYRLIADTDSRF